MFQCFSRTSRLLTLSLFFSPWLTAQGQTSTAQNRWLLCEPDPLSGFVTVDTGAPQDAPLELIADTGQSSESEAILQGDVVAEQGDQRLEASEVTFNRVINLIKAEGNISYGNPELAVRSGSAEVDLNSGEGWFEDAKYYVPRQNAKGKAERVDVQYFTRTSQMRDVTYSTCNRGDEFWQLRAGKLDLNQETGRGVAKDISVALGDVPILYFPYLSFPIDDKRHTGFLVPTVGYGSDNGLDIRIPYYWNIAPNQDMTLQPRILSKRGLMLGAEYRLLTPKGQGEVDFEYLPYDNEYGSDRGAIFTFAQANLAPRLYSNLLFQHVSDDDYLDDFGNKIDILTDTNLERRLDFLYVGEQWTAIARAQTFQTLEDEIFVTRADEPYDRLPQLLFNGDWLEGPPYGLEVDLQAEAVNFERDAGVRGSRLDIWPGVSLPFRWPAGFITPRASYRFTGYDLRDARPGNPKRPSRDAPILSLDSGLFFERPIAWQWWRDNPGILTLEPRLFYLYVPFRDQSDIPVFDSTLIDRNFPWLFLENRFTGADRLGDANQLTMAVTSRWLDRVDGTEEMRLSLGQITYFDDRRVTLAGTGRKRDNSSDIIAEGLVNVTDELSFRGNVQWDPDGNEIQRSGVDLRYRPGLGRLVNVSYRFANDEEVEITREKLEEVDLTSLWTINEQWRAVARFNYSIVESQDLRIFGGFEYDQCCWALRVLARRSRDRPDEDADFSISFQVELKGLAGIGTDIPNLLEESIFGYEPRQRY